MAKQTKKTTKKASSLKTRQHVDHHIRHRITIGAGIVIIGVLVGLVLTLLIIPKIHNDMRLTRINEIYASIELPENRYFEEEYIFGDKRPYEYDTGRTSSSYKMFVIAKTVNETATILDKSIQDAGYVKFEEAYPGSTSKGYYYKSNRGEYIRLNVESKLRFDAATNERLMTGKFSDTFFKIDPNSGPSRVSLKVNLDDNNE